jgi:hypothetical protein
VRAWAVEGAGHCGAGRARLLADRGEPVLEVSRSPRAERRLRGKDDFARRDPCSAGAAFERDARAASRGAAARGVAAAADRAAECGRRPARGARAAAQRDRHRSRASCATICAACLSGSCSSAVAVFAAHAAQAPTSSRHGSCYAASPGGSKRQQPRPVSSRPRSSATSARSHPSCSTSPASARSLPPR